jgi:HAE1 family hydrophobic/amphiphilic exporter-1
VRRFGDAVVGGTSWVVLTLRQLAADLLAYWRGGIGAAFARVTTPVFDAFDRGYAWFADRYHEALHWALDHPWRTLGASALALALSVGGGLMLPRQLLPDVDQGAFEVRIQLPEGSDLQATAAATARIEAALAQDPGVDAVFSRIGRDVRAYSEGEEKSDLNTALLQVRVKPGQKSARVIERVRPAAAQLTGATVTMAAGQATTLGRILGGDASDVAVRIRTEDLDAAQARAAEVAERLSRLDRLANVRVGTERGSPELRVEILRDRAAAYGIDPRAVATTIEDAMRGAHATDYVDFDRKIGVMVRYPDSLRSTRSTLSTLRVAGVPLRELVKVDEVVGPAEVRREDQGRVVTVYADVARGGVQAAIAQVQDVLRGLPATRDVRMEVGGENEEMRRSFRDLLIAFALASAIMYMVLAAEFESFAQPFVILMAVPLSLIGAVIALAVTGQGINTISLIGLVILAGIVDNDAVVKVDFINQARAAGLGVREAILEGGHVRLRPILMTGAGTIVGLLPVALGIGSGAALQAPMAIVVIGGLVVATLLTLVVIPVLYMLIEEARERASRPAEEQMELGPAPLLDGAD